MQSIVRNVRDLDRTDRSALERVVGHPLQETQQVVVNVFDLDPPIGQTGVSSATVNPPWRDIYDGMTEQEIDRLDAAIRQRG